MDNIQLQGQITEEGNTLNVWIAPLEENMALRGWKLRQEGGYPVHYREKSSGISPLPK